MDNNYPYILVIGQREQSIYNAKVSKVKYQKKLSQIDRSNYLGPLHFKDKQ